MNNFDRLFVMREDIVSIVLETGKFIKESFYNNYSVSEKGKFDFVTNIDSKAEDLLKKTILAKYPTASFFGEESGCDIKDKDHHFIVDPIDGTSNFIFGIPYFSISLAEIIDGEIILGIVYNPITNDLFYADKDVKSILNGKAITTSIRTSISELFAILGFSGNKKSINKYQNEWSKLFTQNAKTLPLLSPSLNLCSVAMGRSDLFIDFDCSFEGQIAGSYILSRAGGYILNYDKSYYDYYQKGIIALNSKELLSVLI